ncbi:hypothetical protein LIA77_02905 [Sarocladium implicatum]|nr:hypothetical protein LIA77_02905 [Sarocladium implicatum]
MRRAIRLRYHRLPPCLTRPPYSLWRKSPWYYRTQRAPKQADKARHETKSMVGCHAYHQVRQGLHKAVVLHRGGHRTDRHQRRMEPCATTPALMHSRAPSRSPRPSSSQACPLTLPIAPLDKLDPMRLLYTVRPGVRRHPSLIGDRCLGPLNVVVKRARCYLCSDSGILQVHTSLVSPLNTVLCSATQPRHVFMPRHPNEPTACSGVHKSSALSSVMLRSGVWKPIP